MADEYQSRTGKVASLPEIAEYLEHEAKERLGKIRQTQDGSATKQKANGPRTLSAQAASERRSSPKPIQEMTKEEERQYLMTVAKEAVRESA